MRVITGSAKGKRLNTFKGDRIRPTTDRIKEALFNIIGDEVLNCIFLDCFAGTGSIGIEALSRGARKSYFIENHHESIAVIKENLRITNLYNSSEIISKDMVSGIKRISQYNDKVDIIFLDPPYLKEYIKPALSSIIESNILHSSSLIILEHSKKDMLEHQEGLLCFRQQSYGNTILSFYKKEGN